MDFPQRARAERLRAARSFAYEWNARTTVSSEYEFARDTLAGGVDAAVHRARMGVVRRDDLRTAHRIEYGVRTYGFGDQRAQISHIVLVGWERELTRVSSIDVALGPRLSDGGLRPEVTAVVRARFRRAGYSLSYSRTEATAIGERGSVDVQRIALDITYRRPRGLSITASPAVFRLGRAAGRASIHAVDVQAVHQVTPRLSVAASVRISLQRGTLAGAHIDIPYRTLSVKTTVTFPRARAGGTARSPRVKHQPASAWFFPPRTSVLSDLLHEASGHTVQDVRVTRSGGEYRANARVLFRWPGEPRAVALDIGCAGPGNPDRRGRSLDSDEPEP